MTDLRRNEIHANDLIRNHIIHLSTRNRFVITSLLTLNISTYPITSLPEDERTVVD